MSYEQMMYIGIGMGVVFLTISVVVFFGLGVASAASELSGRTARKKIAEMKSGPKPVKKSKRKRGTLRLAKTRIQSTEELQKSSEPRLRDRYVRPVETQQSLAEGELRMNSDGGVFYDEKDGEQGKKGLLGFFGKHKKEDQNKKQAEMAGSNTTFAIPGQEKKSVIRNKEMEVPVQKIPVTEPAEVKKRGFFSKPREEVTVEPPVKQIYESAINKIDDHNGWQDYTSPGEGGTVFLSGAGNGNSFSDSTTVLGEQAQVKPSGGDTTYLGAFNLENSIGQTAVDFEIETHIVIVHTDELIL